jgi:GT2 family glycosyltransferase
MDVRVGIVSWQTAEHLERCLAALPAALGGLAAEIVVVDNASTDGSADVARRAGAVVIENGSNVGYPRAMNQALAGAASDFLVALNPDTVPAAHSLARLVATLRSDPTAGLAVPRLLNTDGSLQQSVHRFPSVSLSLAMGLAPMPLRRGPIGRHFWLEGFSDHARRQEIDWAIGAVHAIRRDALADPDRPYDERRFMYAEDLALCWSMRERGWSVVFEPEAEVVHVGGAAAAIAFGGEIDELKLAADYDWFADTHGSVATRAYAAANSIGFGVKALVAPIARRRQDPRTVRNRRILRYHARRLFGRGRVG